jgi:hypothetical protein
MLFPDSDFQCRSVRFCVRVNVDMLSVVILSVTKNVVVLRMVMLGVIMLIVIVLNVAAPQLNSSRKCISKWSEKF